MINLSLGLALKRDLFFGETIVNITQETVKYVADLSRIDLQDTEIEKLSQQLESILDFINKLNKLDIKAVLPTSHILPLKNVLRDDDPGNSLSTESVLDNAPQKKDNFFVVPKIIE